jgi:hypothetical protein
MNAIFLLSLGLGVLAAETRLGKPLRLDRAVPLAEVAVRPEPLVGKHIQVKGRISEVCQKMGCWVQLVDPETNAALRVKVNDGEIEFPKDGSGRTAIAEGKLVKIELTREQAVARARHEAEEQKRAFDPATVKGPAVVYQLQGTGAVILD